MGLSLSDPTYRDLEPARETDGRFDATTYLTLWLILLYGLSARQVVPGVGAMGSPAMLLALPTLLIWGGGWILPESGLDRGRHPVRVLLFAFLAYDILSYAVASSRSLTPLEATGATRALMASVAMVGIGLLAADGVRSRGRLSVLLRRVVHAGTFVSIFGIVQFFTGHPLQFLTPGLIWNSPPVTLAERSEFVRPAATTLHSIELSVIVAALLPLAIHFALYSRTDHQRRNAALATGLLALALPLALSRSGLVAVIVALAILFASWRGRRLINALLYLVAVVPLLWLFIPGMVGTFIGLFSEAGDDPSVQARIERRPRVMALVRERPMFGLGNGTWSVEDYFLIDNEIYVTTLEGGLIGMAMTATLLIGAVIVALTVRAMPGMDDATKHLAQALAASIGALSISLLTFDAFHYRILTGTLFLLIGAVGALWRMYGVSSHLDLLVREAWRPDQGDESALP